MGRIGQDLANFFYKVQIVNILNIAGYTVSVTTTQIFYCSMKEFIGNM